MMKFLTDVRNEMQFVKWPTKKAVVISTFAVLVISILMSAFLGGIDLGLKESIARMLVK